MVHAQSLLNASGHTSHRRLGVQLLGPVVVAQVLHVHARGQALVQRATDPQAELGDPGILHHVLAQSPGGVAAAGAEEEDGLSWFERIVAIECVPGCCSCATSIEDTDVNDTFVVIGDLLLKR